MNYEEFYQNAAPFLKELKDLSGLAGRQYKKMAKDADSGNIRELKKSLSVLAEAARGISEFAAKLDEEVDQFDVEEYFKSGQFAEEMLTACKEKEIDVIGDSPVFEMFPYRVRLDVDNQEVYLDRKKIPTVRPETVAETLLINREKIMRANFNAKRFLEELSNAYDLAILQTGKRDGTDILLTNIHKLLVPMGRFRRDYDEHNFAFDMARLYTSEERTTKKGRVLGFGPSRSGGKAIRILDGEGNEQFLSAINFIDSE